MSRTINLIGRFNGEELLAMHESAEQARDCHACLSTGIKIGLVTDQDGNVLGVGVKAFESCECCGGLGYHLPNLNS